MDLASLSQIAALQERYIHAPLTNASKRGQRLKKDNNLETVCYFFVQYIAYSYSSITHDLGQVATLLWILVRLAHVSVFNFLSK